MEDYLNLLRESVNSTISNSHKEYKTNIEAFISLVDKEVRALGSCEKETDKWYANFEAVLQEAEISMAKELPFDKDFWLYEHNFIRSAD